MNNRFIVPQFIDAEDKILGPITVRQFILVIIGGLFIFAAYKLADFTLFLLEAFIILVLTLAFAFVKVNGAPFHLFFANFLNTLVKAKVRIWKKENVMIQEFKSKNEDLPVDYVREKKMIPSRKLSELSLVIDTGGVYKGEKITNQINQVDYR